MDLTLPGLTTIPIGGLTAISVLPTHRRRGILRSMIAYHFEEVEARGELVSALGRPSRSSTAASATAWPPPSPTTRSTRGGPCGAGRAGRVRLLDPEETAKIVPPLYDRYRRGQPGELSRPQGWWDVYARDPEWTRQGASRHHDVVYESAPGRVDGWVSYRVETRWPHGLAANIIKVRMLIGLTPRPRPPCGATSSIWTWPAPQPTPGRSTTRSAGGWPTPGGCGSPTSATSSGCGCSTCRRAAARRYAVSGTLVLEVTDAQRPGTRVASCSRAAPTPACEPTTADPDLALDVADLGAAYLGGASLATLSRANGSPSSTPAPSARRPHVREYPAARLHHPFRRAALRARVLIHGGALPHGQPKSACAVPSGGCSCKGWSAAGSRPQLLLAAGPDTGRAARRALVAAAGAGRRRQPQPAGGAAGRAGGGDLVDHLRVHHHPGAALPGARVVLSGALAALVRPSWLARALPSRDVLAVLRASLAAASARLRVRPVPIAARLRAERRPLGRAMAFMLAAPAINPVVLVSTAVAFPGRPEMVAARFLASLLTSVAAGLVWSRLGREDWIDRTAPGPPMVTPGGRRSPPAPAWTSWPPAAGWSSGRWPRPRCRPW